MCLGSVWTVMKVMCRMTGESGVGVVGVRERLIRLACRLLIEDPSSGDGAERGNSTAGAGMSLGAGVPRREAESAVVLARRRLAGDPALRRSLREALA